MTQRGHNRSPVFSEIVAGSEFQHAFHGTRPTEVNEDVIPVCVPMYNEEADEMLLTLKSLHTMELHLPPGKKMKVCIILDGWLKTHKTMSAALGVMFGEGYWRERLEQAAHAEPQEKLTLILQKSRLINLESLATTEVLGGSLRTIGPELKDRHLDITVVVKVDNRKKHNSHDLFFRGFANHLNSKYAFASDCGTLFDKMCLASILKVMETDKHCIACTGRQRVMTKWQQPGCAAEGCLGWALRTCQGFDYEASTVVYNCCFSLFGCLAVIPGPCGLFRLEPLLLPDEYGVSPFDFYANAATEAEESKEMLMGNCLLAEDRVLTYAALYLTQGGPWSVRWAKHAIFYFQSEVALQTLMGQRRRWLNGTIAGYIFVINQLGSRLAPGNRCGWAAIKVRLVRLLMILMLLIYVGISIGPALYTYGGKVSFEYIMNADDTTPMFEYFGLCFSIVYFLMYLGFVVRHHFVPFDPRFFSLVTAMNAVSALLMIVALVEALIYEHGWIQWIALTYLLLPMVLNAFVPDVQALCCIMNPVNLLVYLLFLPTMQGYFLTLSIARTFDLSWGNRSGVGGEIEGLKSQAQTMIVLMVVFNLVVLCTINNTTYQIQTLENIVLAVFMLMPTAVISFFSAMQAVGGIYFWIALLFEMCFLFLCNYDLENTLNWIRVHVHNQGMSNVLVSFIQFGADEQEIHVLVWLFFVILLKFLFRGAAVCLKSMKKKPARIPERLTDQSSLRSTSHEDLLSAGAGARNKNLEP